MPRPFLLSVFAVLLACGIKGPPKPTRKPAPKAEPPAAVQPLPPRDPIAEGALDGGTELADGGTTAAPPPDGGVDGGTSQ